MGDRGNIAVEYENGVTIHFYTHWTGYRVCETLAEALHKGMTRWDDPAYLARIIFCEMSKDAHDETTGFGISPNVCDNQYPIPCVKTQPRCVEYKGATYSYPVFIQKFRKEE